MPNGHPPKPKLVKVRREGIEKAVKWACQRLNHTIDRPGMNERRVTEKLDDIIMGEIGSNAFMQYITDLNPSVLAYDEIRQDEFKNPDPGWDILVSESDLYQWGTTTDRPEDPPDYAKSFSIKSSRIPVADSDNIKTAIDQRDFKIMKGNKSGRVEDDLTSDFEVQIYYSLEQSRLPDNIKTSVENIRAKNVNAIINDLEIMNAYGECYLTAFVHRDAICHYHDEAQKRGRSLTWPSWHAGHRKEMWVAPLSIGNSIASIANIFP